jgi:hypothetical protein
VATVHGTYHPVISVEFARDARRRLEAAGVDVLYREDPVGHTVEPSALPLLRGWLEETVASAARQDPAREAPAAGEGSHEAPEAGDAPGSAG